ncbi:hypothetical protein EfmJHP35_25760 [Enterococcus faecium]|nr:hypothetical protein EfmJHP35_25760 [Enterococcus faecium]
MFLSIEELVDQAKAYPSVAELMIAVEMEMSGRSVCNFNCCIKFCNVCFFYQSTREKKVLPPSQELPVVMQKN